MRVLFFGTSAFAMPTLQALHDSKSDTVLAVVTQPDRPSGRGRKPQFSPIKERALLLGYTVHQPEKVRRKPFPTLVEELRPDVLVVVSFGQIIPQAMLDFPRWGGINVHASLLPRWRGAAPIHRALIAGDRQTGVATMDMEATLDTGGIYLEAREPIHDTDTVETLEPRLAEAGATLLIETLRRLEAGTIAPTIQSEIGMTYAKPILREEGFLDASAEDAVQLHRRIRGTFPKPGAYLHLGGRLVKVLESAVLPESAAAGTVAFVDKRGIGIGARKGILLLIRVQPENKAAMAAADFARGARIVSGDSVGSPIISP